MINVHAYDGKLKDTKLIYFNKHDKLKLFGRIKKKINNRFLNHIISDFLKYGVDTKSPNYDSLNELYADDILATILDLIFKSVSQNNSDDIFKLFIEQLNDMSTGFCSQGRTVRLIQIFNILN